MLPTDDQSGRLIRLSQNHEFLKERDELAESASLDQIMDLRAGGLRT